MSKKPIVTKMNDVLNKFKIEIANELGVDYLNENISKQMVFKKIANAGNIGGEMVRRMIQYAEKNMVNEQKKD